MNKNVENYLQEKENKTKTPISFEQFCGTDEEWDMPVSEKVKLNLYKQLVCSNATEKNMVAIAFERLNKRTKSGFKYVKNGKINQAISGANVFDNDGNTFNYVDLFLDKNFVYNTSQINFDSVLTKTELKRLNKSLDKNEDLTM